MAVHADEHKFGEYVLIINLAANESYLILHKPKYNPKSTASPRVHFATTEGLKVRDKSATDNSVTKSLSKGIQHVFIKR